MARDAKDEKENHETPLEPKKKSNIKWIIIGLLCVAMVAGIAVGAVFLMGRPLPPKPEEARPAIAAVWPMDAFIVNIADTNGERYLKVVIQLEVSDEKAIPELDQLKPRLRDSILDLLTPKTYKDLMDLSGKQRLREDIAGRVNNILNTGKVTKVFFTDFVVQ